MLGLRQIPSHLVPHQLLSVQDETYLNSGTQASGSGVEGASLASQVLSAGCAPRLVYCLQCRRWKLDESLVVSPSLVSTSRAFPPCCSGERLGSALFVPCSGSSDVSREASVMSFLQQPVHLGTWTAVSSSLADGKKMLSG